MMDRVERVARALAGQADDEFAELAGLGEGDMDPSDWQGWMGAARAAIAAADEWQPIETAPKDGTALLLVSGGCIEYGSWEDVYGFWARPATAEYDNEGLEVIQPTHWQPLPNPPEEGR